MIVNDREGRERSRPQAEHYSYQGRPAAPRNVQVLGGSLEVRVVWNAPADMRGVDGFRVYQNNENQMVFQTKDNTCRQFLCSSVQADTKVAFYVSCFSENGLESVKVQAIGKPNTDQLVVSGTTGATSGTATTPPPSWDSEPSGGLHSGHGAGALE